MVEVDRPNRQVRRREGKSDSAEAVVAARAALSGQALGQPKSRNGDVEAIRVLMIARRSAASERIAALCGTCFGDSGGPIFRAGTSTIVAVTSFGLNENCAGGGFGYRVDTQAVAAWLGQFIEAPLSLCVSVRDQIGRTR